MWRLFMLTLIGVTSTSAWNLADAESDLKVVVILDNSGSMNGRMPGGGARIAAAKQALLSVLDQTPADAEVGVLLLNPGPQGQWLVPLGLVDKRAMLTAVSSLRADGGTPLGATMKKAADALLQLREQKRYGTYQLLIVSDGEATDGDLVNRYLPAIQARGLLVDVIGVAMSQDHSLATRTSTYRRADDPKSLEKAISEVVLGESSPDDTDDTGQSDFELLAPLPGEVAAASLAALTQQENMPVGESTLPDRELAPPNQSVANPPGPAGQANREGRFSLTTIVVAGFILIVLLRVFSSIGKSH